MLTVMVVVISSALNWHNSFLPPCYALRIKRKYRAGHLPKKVNKELLSCFKQWIFLQVVILSALPQL